jgi:signal transduction histidine kinase
MSGASRQDRALDVAALGLVGESVTAAELLARLASQRATLSETDAAEVLDRLAGRGLVRIVSVEGDARYVPTSLGTQSVDATVDGVTLNSQLEELERLRSDLLSTVSHELRTPLTAVRTCVGLLLDPSTHPDEAATRQLLETIERNADRMQRLVTEVLDLARYRTGNVQLQRRRFDARELAEGVVVSISPLATTHTQTVTIHAPGAPLWVYGDHRRLEQALLNLVSNAQKYSPDGSSIDVTVRREGDEFLWEVADNGPGIPAEEQAHLFERFFVGRNDTSEPKSGVGLGLPTALAIAQAHGGRVGVVSAPGRGSRFTLCIPVEPIADEDV